MRKERAGNGGWGVGVLERDKRVRRGELERWGRGRVEGGGEGWRKRQMGGGGGGERKGRGGGGRKGLRIEDARALINCSAEPMLNLSSAGPPASKEAVRRTGTN